MCNFSNDVFCFVGPPKKLNVHFCQKVPFALACCQASAGPRPEKFRLEQKRCTFLP
jgi:hypothetical protein